MSKIEITSSNIDKFVKRFHKVSDAKNNGKKLSESQETFAQSLGCQNYNELKTILENENVNVNEKKDLKLVNELYKGWVIENADTLDANNFLIELNKVVTSKSKEMSKVELFYNQLLTLLNHPKSKISSCLFEKDDFEYSLKLTTCYGDEFTYVFGRSRASLDNVLLDKGFSLLDASLLTSILANSISTRLNLNIRFEAIDFANELYQYLVILRGNKKTYAFKFNKGDRVNAQYILVNDLIYAKCIAFINDFDYLELSNLAKNHPKSDIIDVDNSGYFEQMCNGSGGNLIHYYKNIDNGKYMIKKEDIPRLPKI
jgi:hypothetical protein